MTDAAHTRARYLDTHARLAAETLPGSGAMAGLAAMASVIAAHKPKPATLGECAFDGATAHLEYAARYAAQADGVFMAANGDAAMEAAARKHLSYAIIHARKALEQMERAI